MKNILFKAWNVKKETMSEVFTLCNPPIEMVEAFESGNTEDFKILQFSGFKDGLGNDIFEGDILNLEFNADNEILKEVNVVKFTDGIFRVEISPQVTLNRYLTFDMGGTIEVIGNIYLNPEIEIDEVEQIFPTDF